MSQNFNRKDILQMDLEDLERQIESELYSLQSFEHNMTNRSGNSSNMIRQHSQSSIPQMNNKKYGVQHVPEKGQSILQPMKNQQSFGDALNRQNSKSQFKSDTRQSQNPVKIMEPSIQLKEKNKNLFTIEDLKSEEAKKTVRRRSKSPIAQANSNVSSRMVSKRNDYKSDKENNNPSTAFQSGRTIASSVRSNEGQIQFNKGNNHQSNQKIPFAQQQNSNQAKTQQQRLQQQSQQIRQNIFDLIQNDKFDSAESNNNYNNDEQAYIEENTFSNQNNSDGYYGQKQHSNRHIYTQDVLDERENYNYINFSREDDDINKLLASKLPQSQKNTSGFNTQDSGSTVRGMKKNNNAQQDQDNANSQLRRSQSNLNSASSRYSQVRSSKNSAITQTSTTNKSQYVDENCTFKPMLSKKSMELADRMEDPRVRLTQPKNEEKLNKLRNSIESQYSYRPQINKNTDRHLSNFQQESVFNYSDEDDDEMNQYDNEEDFSLNRNNKQRQSSQSQGQKQPRWQQLYEQHKVYQMEKEIKLIQKEKEEQEDPELTFQPRLYRSKESNYMYGDNEYDINQRCQIWTQKRQEKIKRVAEQFENRDLIGCTFQPNVSSINNNNNNHGQSTTSNKNNNTHKTSNYNNQHEFSQQITEFNKKGIIEYFERIDAAKKKKQESEELQNKITGQAWKNKITIPQEFSFMKKENRGQRSTSNLRSHRNNDMTLNKSRDRSKSPSNVSANKIMLFYKTRSLSSNNLCQVDPDENAVYHEVSNSINNWDRVKENLHRHIHQMKI